ncbi:hypothetical protein CcCBS67573_g09922 [Chytriomyces confervae]|uniref:Uncharacterized protein n=1 Tax=Chytriomyces confervae TaxID=246404 RepID=A0A507DL71_9FUNG|nr:hypothetical protein CcCBS67573_g09922 [Chytriomyces confervae]
MNRANPGGHAMRQNECAPSTADMGLTPSTFARIQPRTRGRPSGVQLLNLPQSSAVERSEAQRHQITSSNSPSSGSLQHANGAPVSLLQHANAVPARGRSNGSNDLEESNHQNNGTDAEEEFEDANASFTEANDQGLGIEFADEEQRARNQYLEHQALRAQADWAHNSQDGTRIYAEPQKEYKSWCETQGYPETFVTESRLLRFLKHLETRPLKKRGRKSTQDYQMRTTRKINGEVVLLECRNKAGDIVFRHEDYDNLTNNATANILSHHSIKVYLNALVHLYFWQTVDVTDQEPKPLPTRTQYQKLLLKHKEDHERRKATSSDDAGLDNMALRIDDAKWMQLAMRMLKSKKLVEEESITRGPVEILIGRSKVSKTNHYERAEHFGFFRSKNVLECSWGWQVEIMARGYSVGIDGRIWTTPDVSNRDTFYQVKVLHDPKYGSMYKAVCKAMEEIGLHSKVTELLESGHYATAIAESDYLAVMTRNREILVQDMAGKMDDATYMAAIGNHDSFLNCLLFDNDDFRAYRIAAHEKRAALSAELTRSQELERAVPEVVSALDGIRYEGLGQHVTVVEGIETLDKKVSALAHVPQHLFN